jgi:pyridinium-3,5-biscarboxylic acid mononucleotide sulfurtransferase
VSYARSAGDATSLSDAASLERKEAALHGALRELPSLIVAYSGGVDSAYLAYAAHRMLRSRLLCVTADSPSYPERHRAIARQVAEQFGFNHVVIQTS